MTVHIEALRGDLTRHHADALVNAANETLLGGGGVDGALHRVAGPGLLKACRQLPEVAQNVRCPTGEVRVTPAFDLPARWVLHTVGPVWDRHPDPASVLYRLHRRVLAVAESHGCRSVALPAISCGVYGAPADRAARIAVRAAREAPTAPAEVRFVLWNDDTLEAWRTALRDL